MCKPIIFQTEENKYWYFKKERILFFLHPVMEFIISNKFEVENFLNRKENELYVSNYGIANRKEIEYYLQKVRLIIKEVYVSNFDISGYTYKFLDNRLSSRQLAENISNSQLVLFEVTEKCNLKCNYCGYGELYVERNRRNNKELYLENAKTTLRYLSKHRRSEKAISQRAEHGVGFYGGEPLVNFKLVEEIVKYCKELGLNVKFQMTTNGTLLRRYIDFLAEHKFHITISLDGNKIHNHYRKFKDGKESFDEVFKNSKFVKNEFPKYFNNYVSFNAVYTNKGDIDEIHDFFHKEFDKNVILNPLSKMGLDKTKMDSFSKIYKPLFYDDIKKNEHLYLECLNSKSIDKFIENSCGGKINSFADFLYENNHVKKQPTGTCELLQEKIMVRVDGSVHFCESIPTKFAAGKVVDDELDINYSKIASTHNRILDYLVERYCNSCYISDSCSLCIYELAGDDEKKIVCREYTGIEQFKKKLISQIDKFEKFNELYSGKLNNIEKNSVYLSTLENSKDE